MYVQVNQTMPNSFLKSYKQYMKILYVPHPCRPVVLPVAVIIDILVGVMCYVVSHLGFNEDILSTIEVELLFNKLTGQLYIIFYDVSVQSHFSIGFPAFLS